MSERDCALIRSALEQKRLLLAPKRIERTGRKPADSPNAGLDSAGVAGYRRIARTR